MFFIKLFKSTFRQAKFLSLFFLIFGLSFYVGAYVMYNQPKIDTAYEISIKNTDYLMKQVVYDIKYNPDNLEYIDVNNMADICINEKYKEDFKQQGLLDDYNKNCNIILDTCNNDFTSNYNKDSNYV